MSELRSSAEQFPLALPLFESPEALADALAEGGFRASELPALDSYLDEATSTTTPPDKRAADNFQARFHGALDLLPERHPEFAREVYRAYAEDGDSTNRSSAAVTAPILTRADHDFGVMLWDQLMRDEDPSVRGEASNYLFEALEADADEPAEAFEALKAGDNEAVDAALAKLGLTRPDAYQLLAGYEAAKRGEHIFNLGATTLQRLVELTSTVGEQSASQ